MCGILAIFCRCGVTDLTEFRNTVYRISKRQRHRGPDWTGINIVNAETAIAHERLAVIGISSGAQPLVSHESDMILTVNGEIYNYLQIKSKLYENGKHKFLTESDCEVILHLYEEIGENIVHEINGIFAFVLYDAKSNSIFAVRDPIGVNPLYQGWAKDGSVWFASEMKCLTDSCERIISFPPGTYYTSKNPEETRYVRYYEPVWHSLEYIPKNPINYEELKNTLITAVRSQMMSEVPFGVLLSGGLDSSLIASIASKIIKNDMTDVIFKTFSIGLKNAPDLEFAKRVATYLGSQHHEFNFTIEEGIDCIEDVVYHLETYDVTTIRASTPMFLLSKHIKALGVKMVMSGEGSDEIFGGYLYFHNAPNADDLHKECVTRVKNLHYSDCLRANKSTMAWGVEVRVPFLDINFVDYSMTIDPKEKVSDKNRMEKYILRKAFDDGTYLPHEILWRQKEQFSDGVGYSWIDSLRSFAESRVQNHRFKNAAAIYPYNTPTTKEAFYYRDIFNRLFPGTAAESTVERWVPRTDWGCSDDPSGRAQKAHTNTII